MTDLRHRERAQTLVEVPRNPALHIKTITLNRRISSFNLASVSARQNTVSTYSNTEMLAATCNNGSNSNEK
jgi:hypothetical protein